MAYRDSFLPSLEDLSPLPWEFYDCTEENLGVVGYDYDLDGAGNVQGINVEGNTNRSYTERTFCYVETQGTAVSVVVVVPDDKLTLDHWRQAHAELAAGTGEGLRVLSDAFMEDRDGELVRYKWLPAGSQLGELGYGAYYLVRYPDYDLAYYDYDFMRGLVTVAVLFTMHERTDLSQETDAIMSKIDERIKSRLQAVVADSDAHPLSLSPSPTPRPSMTVSTEFSGCLNETGVVDVRASDLFAAQMREAMDVLPEEYRSLVNCWLTSIVEDTTASRPGAGGFVSVRSGTYHVLGHAVPHADNDVGAVADAAGGMVHEAVHVREYWHGRPFEGKDGELTALKAEVEVLLKIPTFPEQLLCLWDLIDNIDDPAYQYWNGADPPCEAAGIGPASPTPN